MNYVYFLLTDDTTGRFTIEVLYEKQDADKLPKDLVWAFTDPQLDLLYELLLPYYLGYGIYFYRSIEAIMEVSMCQNADEILTLLSWSKN